MKPLYRELFSQLFYVLLLPLPSLPLSKFPWPIFDPEFHVHECDHDHGPGHRGPDHRGPDLYVHANGFEILSVILTGFYAHDVDATAIGCFVQLVAKLIVREKLNVTANDDVSSFFRALCVAHCCLRVHGVLDPGV